MSRTAKQALRWAPTMLALSLVLNACGDAQDTTRAAVAMNDPDVLLHGEYLAKLGGCVACHSAHGQATLAGGRVLPTEFGRFYPPNITPNPEVGIGAWSADDFWRAMHHGESPDGHAYYPAFPYPWFSKLSRADVNAIYAWLMAQPASAVVNRAHELKSPYQYRSLLRVWRWLYFDAGVYTPDLTRDAVWNRGAYLVQGIGHCDACHRQRGWLGGPGNQSAGAFADLGGDAWYAPSLRARDEAGVQDWPIDHIQALLQTGISPSGSAIGPMAEYVFTGTQTLNNPDAIAIATYLKTLPAAEGTAHAQIQTQGVPARQATAFMRLGGTVYSEHCAACHGESGAGTVRGRALAGNRAVTLPTPSNVLHSIQRGGYLPGTPGHSRPNGMPPFAHTLSAQETAAVATYIRNSWGNAASPLSPRDVEAGLPIR